jgi:hypothetical protein
MVKERGSRLRGIPFADLKGLADKPLEHVLVESRKATIGTIVLPLPTGGIQVVLQGFMEHRFMPGESVALDGFYKYPDDTRVRLESASISNSCANRSSKTLRPSFRPLGPTLR